MKKTLLVVTLTLSLTACGFDKSIENKNIPYYGLFNRNVQCDPHVVYQISPTNVIIGIVFIETVFVPVYIVGWDLYEPVKPQPDPKKNFCTEYY